MHIVSFEHYDELVVKYEFGYVLRALSVTTKVQRLEGGPTANRDGGKSYYIT